MALINCPECGKEISNTTNKCPHCGYVVKPRLILDNIKKKNIFVGLFSAISLMLIIFAVNSMNKSPIDIAVKRCITATRESLLAPDSMIIYKVYARQTLSSTRKDKIMIEAKTSEEYDEKIAQEPDDTIEVYIYYGATNRGGGVSDDEYLYVCDMKGNILDRLTEDEYEEMSGDSDKISNHSYVYDAWLSFQFFQLGGKLDEKYINYSEQYKASSNN